LLTATCSCPNAIFLSGEVRRRSILNNRQHIAAEFEQLSQL
jgi:hypothetical protein